MGADKALPTIPVVVGGGGVTGATQSQTPSPDWKRHRPEPGPEPASQLAPSCSQLALVPDLMVLQALFCARPACGAIVSENAAIATAGIRRNPFDAVVMIPPCAVRHRLHPCKERPRTAS